MRDQILILNFNSIYAAAIAMRLRAEKISCRIVPGDIPVEDVINEEALGMVLAGGLTGELPGMLDGQLLRTGMPVLALGDTAAAVTALLGGSVGERYAINMVDTIRLNPSRITGDLEQSERMLGYVYSLGLTDDLAPLAQNDDDLILGVMHRTLDIYALQTQLEPNDPDMMGILLRFSQDVCGCTKWWSEDAFISMAKASLSEAAGEGNAVCVMSGGLNSGVSALIAHRALGDRLQCVFVDTGLLRENEADNFIAYYRNAGLNLKVLRSGQRFLDALKGVTEQDEKRKAIADILLSELKNALLELPFDLVIESYSGSAVISSQESSSGTPRMKTGKPSIAPLSELFKDEIRLVGEALGMPQELTKMQPFPWTGLALRIMGECTQEKLNILRRADAEFSEEIRLAGLSRKLWKYFAMLYQAPYNDETDTMVIALRAVSANHQGSGIRAIPARLPYDLLERYTQHVMSANPLIGKVVYDLTPGSSLQQAEWQ